MYEGIQYGKRAGMPVVGENPSFFAVRSWGSEQTVTVSPTTSHSEPKPPEKK